jgi:tetratricopeptide (TPR) repeat protein
MLPGNRKAAQREFLKTVELQPNHAAALYNLGWIRQSAGSFDGASEYYDRALKADPAFWQAHQNLGNVLVIQGKLREAQEQYQEVVRDRPDYWPVYQSLAALQLRLSAPTAALETLNRLKALQPDLQDAFLLTARALFELHRFPEAERELLMLESKDRHGAYREQVKALRELMRPGRAR